VNSIYVEINCIFVYLNSVYQVLHFCYAMTKYKFLQYKILKIELILDNGHAGANVVNNGSWKIAKAENPL